MRSRQNIDLSREQSFQYAEIQDKQDLTIGIQNYGDLTIQQVFVSQLVNLEAQIAKSGKDCSSNSVICLPSFYDHCDRISIVEAIQASGIKSNLLIDEQVATAMAYLYYKGNNNMANILFIDFGYSKLSIFVFNFIG